MHSKVTLGIKANIMATWFSNKPKTSAPVKATTTSNHREEADDKRKSNTLADEVVTLMDELLEKGKTESKITPQKTSTDPKDALRPLSPSPFSQGTNNL